MSQYGSEAHGRQIFLRDLAGCVRLLWISASPAVEDPGKEARIHRDLIHHLRTPPRDRRFRERRFDSRIHKEKISSFGFALQGRPQRNRAALRQLDRSCMAPRA